LGIEIDCGLWFDDPHAHVSCKDVGEFNAGLMADGKVLDALSSEKLFNAAAARFLTK
jgi:hypothetical protein